MLTDARDTRFNTAIKISVHKNVLAYVSGQRQSSCQRRSASRCHAPAQTCRAVRETARDTHTHTQTYTRDSALVRCSVRLLPANDGDYDGDDDAVDDVDSGYFTMGIFITVI